MVSFPDRLDLIHRSIWDKVCRKHLKRREGRKRKNTLWRWLEEPSVCHIETASRSNVGGWSAATFVTTNLSFWRSQTDASCNLSFASSRPNAKKKKAWCMEKVDVAWLSSNFLDVRRCSAPSSINGYKDVPSYPKEMPTRCFWGSSKFQGFFWWCSWPLNWKIMSVLWWEPIRILHGPLGQWATKSTSTCVESFNQDKHICLLGREWKELRNSKSPSFSMMSLNAVTHLFLLIRHKATKRHSQKKKKTEHKKREKKNDGLELFRTDLP